MIFLFLFFSLFFRFCAVLWIKLAISSAFERTLIYRIVSYSCYNLLISPPSGVYCFSSLPSVYYFFTHQKTIPIFLILPQK